MSTAPITQEPQIQTTPTDAGTTPPAPVQQRDEQGRFAAQPTQAPQTAPVQTPPAPPTPAAPAPFTQQDLGNGRVKVTYQTGETFEGTPNEILSKVAEAHINTKRWAQQQRQVQPEPVVQEPAKPQSPFASTEDEQAANYVSDLIAKKFGFSNAQEMQERLGNTVNTSQDYMDNQLSIQFMASNPDFNPTDENSGKLIDAIVSMGFGPVYETAAQEQRLALMNMAHAYNLKNKVYTAMPQQTGASVSNNLPAPPPIPTPSSPADTFSSLPENLKVDVNMNQAEILRRWQEAKSRGLI